MSKETMKPGSAASSSNKTEDTKIDESLIETVNSEEDFEDILHSIKEKYILVEFFAVWCGPCKMLTMKFQELAEKYPDKLKVLKVDIDKLEELALEYDVKQMPSFMIMKNGKKLQQYFGSKMEQVDEMVNKYLATTS